MLSPKKEPFTTGDLTMKTIIALFIILSTISIANAAVINVAGTNIKIPNKYKKLYVQDKANECVAMRLTDLRTDAAVKIVALDCTNMVLRNDFSWRNQTNNLKKNERKS